MVQLLFGLNSDSANPSKMVDFFREIFVVFDKVVYSMIGFVYNVLFNIADSNIIDPDIIKEFYGRVQLILGVIMIFKVSVSLMQYVINPDAFADKKTGFGQIITRIVTMLAMLTAIVPLNIPSSATEKNSYNSYLNQHGLLFGTLYSLQHRILAGNTIGKLVLGSNSNTITTTDDNDEDKSTVKYSGDSSTGNEIASTILKSFISINYKEKQPTTEEEGESDDSYVCAPSAKTSKNYVQLTYSIATDTAKISNAAILSQTPVIGPFMTFAATKSLRHLIDTIKETLSTSHIAYYYDAWLKTNDPSVIADMASIKCSNGYAFAYLPIASTFCGIILLVTLAASCLDVAIRALKLAVLRLLAPIAIISYIDPKSAEKGAFGSWVKMVISTYLELFLRLAILYFVIFLVDGILHGGLDLPYTGGTVGTFSTILIIIGLFYFARQAPKFITDALGIKSLGMGVGISGLLGAVGSFMGGGGLTGAMSGFIGASNDAANAAAQGKQAPPAYATQRAKMAQMITGDEKNDGSLAYRMQRGLQNMAGASAINRLYGVNKRTLADAKQKMYDTADDATRAKNAYDNFMKDSQSQYDNYMKNSQSQYDNFINGSKADVAKALGFDYDEQSGYMMDQDGNLIDDDKFLEAKNQRASAMLSTRDEWAKRILSARDVKANELEAAYIDAESVAGKAKSDYEKMQKIADRANVTMTAEQEHRASVAERFGGVYHAISHPIASHRDRTPEHQTLKQRIKGDNKFK